MLSLAFEEAAPYISNLNIIKEFVEKNKDKQLDTIFFLLNEKVNNSTGTLKTDFKILLMELEKIINKRM